MSASFTTTARENMLKSQILTGHVLNPHVIEAMSHVVREDFLPPQYKGVAYVDEEVSLGEGRFLLEPLAFARMLENAAITAKDSVLDVACGSGYSSAVLSRIAARVVAVEESPTLAGLARKLLAACSNVTVAESPLVDGAHATGPYDVILIEGAVEYISQALADQLKEGGRLYAFEQNAKQHIGTSGLNNLVEYKKIHNMLYRTVICDTSVAKLMAFNKPAMFAF